MRAMTGGGPFGARGAWHFAAMDLSPNDCCILNGGDGAWAFAPLAEQLSAGLGVEISATPRRYNYALTWHEDAESSMGESFIPRRAVEIAADKRLLAQGFAAAGVPTPETVLCESLALAQRHAELHGDKSWCLKYPTGCGGSGHRMLTATTVAPPNWPMPFVVQEFIRLDQPEVFRTYAIGGEIFGWVARRFPPGATLSPWVAHARGARYCRLEGPPTDARDAAGMAIRACGLDDSFGCVDILCTPDGEWLVLEVGTDGIVNHVDRELDDPEMERELLARIARAFWQKSAAWRPQC